MKEESDAVAYLETAARTAVNYMKQCGNEVVIPENEDEFAVDVLYNIFCRQYADIPLKQRVQDIISLYREIRTIYPAVSFLRQRQLILHTADIYL